MDILKGAKTPQNKGKTEDTTMWKTGRIGSPSGEGIYEYHAKVYDEGSDWGINEGRISKLEIRKVGESKWLYNYDRGLDIDCQTEETRTILNIILAKYA